MCGTESCYTLLNALITSFGSKLQERWKVFDFEVKKNWTPREKLEVKDRGAQGLHIACEYPILCVAPTVCLHSIWPNPLPNN